MLTNHRSRLKLRQPPDRATVRIGHNPQMLKRYRRDAENALKRINGGT